MRTPTRGIDVPWQSMPQNSCQRYGQVMLNQSIKGSTHFFWYSPRIMHTVGACPSLLAHGWCIH